MLGAIIQPKTNQEVAAVMKTVLLSFCGIALCLFLVPATTHGTPEYAAQTGLACRDCHIDPSGGGQLTPQGEKFLSGLTAKGEFRKLSLTQRAVRLLIGYLHILAGVIWFGAILYVHLLLKPAYASKGLPRGEMRLGWVAMLVVLITGVLLTIARMPTLQAFVATRFGILLTIKIALFLVMFASALIVTLVIGPRLKQRLGSPVAAVAASELTPEELAHYDGQEGRPAYIAYQGVVYDLTDSRLWKKGLHMGKHRAGTDLTAALKTAPHSDEAVLAAKPIAMLVTAGHRPAKPWYERLFYFFAYMNLVLVFVVLFIIALWRWW